MPGAQVGFYATSRIRNAKVYKGSKKDHARLILRGGKSRYLSASARATGFKFKLGDKSAWERKQQEKRERAAKRRDAVRARAAAKPKPKRKKKPVNKGMAGVLRRVKRVKKANKARRSYGKRILKDLSDRMP